jgi:hypothetical protein
MGTRKNDKHQLLTRTYTNQTTSWLVRSLNVFGAQTHHSPDEPRANMDSQDSPRPRLGEVTTFPFIVHFMPGHETNTEMTFCPGTPATLCADLRLR